MDGSTLMTKTLDSFPTKSAHPLLAGKIPLICTGTTSFFIRNKPLYGLKLKKTSQSAEIPRGRRRDAAVLERRSPTRRKAGFKTAPGRRPALQSLRNWRHFHYWRFHRKKRF